MQAHYRTPRRRPMAEINVVPYIDVMLVLLVIFMITAPLVTAGVDVDLPQADAEVIDANEEPPLIASIDESGNYYLSVGDSRDQALSLDELVALVAAQREQQPTVQIFVNGDKNSAYGAVVEMLFLLQQEAGVENVGLMTEPSS